VYNYVGNSTYAGFAANFFGAPSPDFPYPFIVTTADGFALPLFFSLSTSIAPNAGVSIEQFNRYDGSDVTTAWISIFDKPAQCKAAAPAQTQQLRAGGKAHRQQQRGSALQALRAAVAAGPAPPTPGFTAPTLPIIPNYRMRYTHANLSSELPDGADLGSQVVYNSADAQIVRIDTTIAKPVFGVSFLRNISYCGALQKGYIEVGTSPYELTCAIKAEACTVLPLDLSSLAYAGNVTLETPGFPLYLYVNTSATTQAQPFVGVAVSADGLIIPQIALLPAPEGQTDALIVHQFDAVEGAEWFGAFDEPPECAAAVAA